MPWEPANLRIGLACGVGADGHWHGWFDICVPTEALRRLGLHPDQPTAAANGPSPPGWWHAEAERRARRQGQRSGPKRTALARERDTASRSSTEAASGVGSAMP